MSDGPRIAIVGCPGAGKSTLAARLADALSVSHIGLDDLYFGPNWQPVDRHEFETLGKTALSRSTWVIDGNYGLLRHDLLERATTVVWLDAPRRLAVSRVAQRSIHRIRTAERVSGDNTETMSRLLNPRQSAVVYAYRRYRPLHATLSRLLGTGPLAGKTLRLGASATESVESTVSQVLLHLGQQPD